MNFSTISNFVMETCSVPREGEATGLGCNEYEVNCSVRLLDTDPCGSLCCPDCLIRRALPNVIMQGLPKSYSQLSHRGRAADYTKNQAIQWASTSVTKSVQGQHQDQVPCSQGWNLYEVNKLSP